MNTALSDLDGCRKNWKDDDTMSTHGRLSLLELVLRDMPHKIKSVRLHDMTVYAAVNNGKVADNDIPLESLEQLQPFPLICRAIYITALGL